MSSAFPSRLKGTLAYVLFRRKEIRTVCLMKNICNPEYLRKKNAVIYFKFAEGKN